MNRFGRVLLAIVVALMVVPFSAALPAQAADGICPLEGCNLYFPLTRNAGPVLKVGMVTDSGGITDRSFNQMTWQGVKDAESQLFIDGSFIEGGNEISYADAIEQMVNQGNKLIVTVGFLMAEATEEAAAAYPEVKFSIVDSSYEPALNNVIGQVYASEQGAFLAGYLAAGMTVTGKVATFGGMNIPPVTQFMNGFHQGVVYYNVENATQIEVLGWDPTTHQGEFTDDFGSQQAGLAMGQKLLGQGADVLFPVAGPTGFGAAQAVQQAQIDAWVIGVDTDWTVTVPEYSNVTLTSVMKNTGATTYGVIKQTLEGNFSGGNYTGTLANEGVGLGTIAVGAPAALLAKVEHIRTSIINGSIEVMP